MSHGRAIVAALLAPLAAPVMLWGLIMLHAPDLWPFPHTHGVPIFRFSLALGYLGTIIVLICALRFSGLATLKALVVLGLVLGAVLLTGACVVADIGVGWKLGSEIRLNELFRGDSLKPMVVCAMIGSLIGAVISTLFGYISGVSESSGEGAV